MDHPIVAGLGEHLTALPTADADAPARAGRIEVFIRFGARPEASCVVEMPRGWKRSMLASGARVA
jgi:hypothetical protein